MGSEVSFYQNEVLLTPEVSRFTRLGDPQPGSSVCRDLKDRNEVRTPKFSIFSTPFLSI